MAIEYDKLIMLIRGAFPEAEIKLVDLVGDANHYSLVIRDKSFAGLSRISQHKLVNKALEKYLGDELHALQIKTEAI
jgi:stress-induced morphogen